MNIHWIHCIEKCFTVQHFSTTCTCPEKLSFPRNFSLYWLHAFNHSGFLSNLCLPWKQSLPWNFSLYWIHFLQSGFLSNLPLPWKTVCLEFTYWMHILHHSGILSSLRLSWKQEFALKFFTRLKYLLSFRNFEQLALALKTEFALKIFKPGNGSPPARLVRLWAPMV